MTPLLISLILIQLVGMLYAHRLIKPELSILTKTWLCVLWPLTVAACVITKGHPEHGD